jgi:hypothetical protein
MLNRYKIMALALVAATGLALGAPAHAIVVVYGPP